MNHMLKQGLSLVAPGLACAATDSRAQGGVAQSDVRAEAFDAEDTRVAKCGGEDASRRTDRHLRRVLNGAVR
ncbi:hypothetical protein [Burkholderia pseudomultivorans]|uniref:Secreted protein n=1 Tax=Burkholderia pseudomultivorans TaxID=1207504 RepID=A0ABU2E3M5_9BURK|nr:hypothetical protein [Burkholderia pseudomultivorans]MDR8729638.1 hypothetical protein [Burkholderia pseudomultivorans]MDR8737025.1 hypothetical protein [Burkholderia pseudomultivorans]MDR8743080.1 hypothetical protein [Burkholderia pseudomultivorans]MDR8754455.1 hypothetical protein [Burkholderia pseudomultivorans]MDR8779808.1 hypothetical protein [Burkholderia pseudomultivorans]